MIGKFFQDKAWALEPAKLAEVTEAVELLLSGVRTEYQASAGIADPSYTSNGIRVIKVHGVLSQRANLLTNFSGGTSTEMLQKEFREAMEDPTVSGVLLDIDSPGGEVHGTKTLADTISASRGLKPIVAHTDGLMASAAYWIASAADKIYATQTSEIGSIGVSLVHYDRSKKLEAEGVKATEIYAGEYKRSGSDLKALDEASREYLQSKVDTYYGIFVDSVASNRGISTDEALNMADGRTYIGKEALDVGMIDEIGNFSEALNSIRRNTQMEDNGLQFAALAEENQKLKVALRRSEVQMEVDKLVAAGRVTPAQVEAGLVDRLSAMDEETSNWMLESVFSHSPTSVLMEEIATDGVVRTQEDLAVDLIVSKFRKE